VSQIAGIPRWRDCSGLSTSRLVPLGGRLTPAYNAPGKPATWAVFRCADETFGGLVALPRLRYRHRCTRN
jgi:hypothetical protein